VLVPDTTDTTEWRNDLASTFGSTNPILGDGMIKYICFAATPGDSTNVQSANFVLSFTSEAKPRDPHAANLAVYAAGLYDEIMKSKRRLGMARTDQQLDNELNRHVKLVRAACHVALTSKNYNSAPAQTVTVQNVSVSDGGQAIVGTVNQTPHGTPSAADGSPAGSDVIDGTLAHNDNRKEEPDDVRRLDKGEGQ
jgi:hypothetical protein